MPESLNIAVADDEPDVLEFYEVVLADLGHKVVCSARNGRDLVNQCHAMRPDLVIVDVRMPQLDGLDAIREISRGHPIPAIVVSGYHEPETLRRAENDHALAYLIKPIRKADLHAAIGIVMRQHQESKSLRGEVVDVLQAMDDQQVVARATRLLMEVGLDAKRAAQRLRELAHEQDRPLPEIARTVEAICDPPAAESLALRPHCRVEF